MELPLAFGNLDAIEALTSATVASPAGISTVKGSPRAKDGGFPAADIVKLVILLYSGPPMAPLARVWVRRRVQVVASRRYEGAVVVIHHGMNVGKTSDDD